MFFAILQYPRTLITHKEIINMNTYLETLMAFSPDSKYVKMYVAIIHNRLNNGHSETYSEKHHILPRCTASIFETSDIESKNNIVNLTAREHYICHKLLSKVDFGKTINKKLKYAYCCMAFKQGDGGSLTRKYKITSREYDNAKRIMSAIQKEYHWSQTESGRKRLSAIRKSIAANMSVDKKLAISKRLSDAGKGKPKSDSHKNKISAATLGVKKTRTPKLIAAQEKQRETKHICPKCSRSFDMLNFNRYHGDKCGISSSVKGTKWFFNEELGKKARFFLGKEPPGYVLCSALKEKL